MRRSDMNECNTIGLNSVIRKLECVDSTLRLVFQVQHLHVGIFEIGDELRVLEIAEFFHDIGDPLSVRHHCFDILHQFLFPGSADLLFHHLKGQHHDAERIVDLVTDRNGKFRDRLFVLILGEFLLQRSDA